MSNNTVANTRILLGMFFATFSLVSGLASCGGVKADATSRAAPLPASTMTLSAFAAPTLVTYNATSVITWTTSTGSTSCSSSPAGITGTSGSFTTPPLTTTTTYTITCLGQNPSDKASKSVTIGVGQTSITNVADACATMPMRGPVVYYYCDCGTGAQAGCIPGNDSNSGLDEKAPRRSIANAVSLFNSNSLVANDTVAFCNGGAFNAPAGLTIGSTRCAGTACNDFRNYAPTTFAGTAKPIINNATGAATLFSITNNRGGIRFLNLRLRGDGGAIANHNHGFFLYNGAHDVTMCNLDIDAFDLAIYSESGNGGTAIINNIKITGNTITNNRTMGYLGSGSNSEISYNFWDGNGSTNPLDHTLYLGSEVLVSNVSIVGNYIHGQYGSVCTGSPVVAHAAVDGLNVTNNTVAVEAAQTTAGCWGMGLNNNTSNIHPVYFRNAVFSGNTIINGGNTAFTISSCPSCIIENNLIIQNWAAGGAIGINVVEQVNRGQDDTSNANVIRNNTIWFGPNSNGTNTGIRVYREGTGHVIANNTVSSTQTVGTLNCFDYPLALSSYAFIDNNHCNASSFSWVTGRSLVNWQTYSSANGFDSASKTGSPLFTTTGTNFVPGTGSPLLNSGDTAHGSAFDLNGKTRVTPPAIGAFEP